MNVNVSLTDELADFVRSKVSAGRYTSSSEVIREALRLMEKVEQQQAEQLRFLREAWQEGIDSGDAGELDFAALKEEPATASRCSQRGEAGSSLGWWSIVPFPRSASRCALMRRGIASASAARCFPATAEPHALVALHVVEQAGQGADPAGPADDAGVQADRHHARPPLLPRR